MRRRFLYTLLILIPLLYVNADFFMRFSRGAESVLKGMGGSKVYQSSVEINGSAGELSSFTFSETSNVVAARLARKLKLPQPESASAVMLKPSGKTLTRYFVLQAPALQNNSFVTVLEQKPSAFKGSLKGAPPWPTQIPVLNATAKFTAHCAKTRTTFLSAISNSSTPAQAVEECRAILSTEGWEEMVPSTDTFKIFVNKSKQRVVFADQNLKSHEITINVLQREGSGQ